ncbi:MAG: helicase, partial [Caulobacteraceae bacterium]|nr:helicase [Caulobacteraceae bacterium]
DLGTGQLKVLTSCDIISEGTDIPSVTGAILLRPTDSLGLHLQQVGRVLRPCPGKPHAIVNDHVGNTLRHGLPTDPRDWSLEGRPKGQKRQSDAPPVRICPACFSAIPSAANPCPECGHEVEQARRELKVVEGDLQELQAAAIARQRRVQVGQARTREELETIRLERGYSRGWTDHILRARGNRHGGTAFG